MSTENTGTTETVDSLELARKAINHVLKQIQKNPDIRYHMGACTQSFELLKEAHSAMNGISPDAIEKETFVALSRKSASERIAQIRDMADAAEGNIDLSVAAIREIATICRA